MKHVVTGHNLLPGGLWTLLVSCAGLRTGALPRVLNYLGVVAGIAGILTMIPALSGLVAVFALGQIAWFTWLGLLMLFAGEEKRGVQGHSLSLAAKAQGPVGS